MVFYFTGRKYSWVENYDHQSDEPYGTSVFKRLLQENVGEENFILRDEKTMSFPDGKILYILINNYAYLDSAEIAELDSLTKSGNTVLLAVNVLSSKLFNRLGESSIAELIGKSDSSYTTIPDSSMVDSISISHVYWPWMDRHFTDTSVILSSSGDGPSRRIEYVVNNYRQARDWSYFGKAENLPFDEGYTPYAHFNDSLINYIGFQRGNGELRVHLCPLAFTNFNLLEESGLEYASACLEGLTFDKIIWDEYNTKWQDMDPEDFRRSYSPSEGPLAFILSQPGLRWAWYLLLLGALLYVLFGARRKQRPIPIIHKLQNTSIEFSEQMSRLYQKKKDHRPIAKLKWKLFLEHIRTHYGLNTNCENEEEQSKLISRIALRSGIATEKIKELFDTHKKINIIFEVDKELLVRFHHLLEEFYSQSK
jgi:hypothetical protein